MPTRTTLTAIATVLLAGLATASPAAAAQDARGITVSVSALSRVEAPKRLADETIERAVEAAEPRAVARALRRARARAGRLAEAADLTLTERVAVGYESTPFAFGPFRQENFCRERRARRGRERTIRCRVPAFTASFLTVTFATRETTDAPEPARTITSNGTGRADVDPSEKTSPAIRLAIVESGREADPAAIEDAKAEAAELARSAGIGVGPILSIADPGFAAFGPYGPYGGLGASDVLGPYGFGKFCARVRRFAIRRDPDTGVRRAVPLGRKKRCFVPREAVTTLRVTFAG